MKIFKCILLFILLVSTSLNAANKRIAPARMGKMGTPHPAAWQVIDKPEVEGKGEIYTVEISIQDKSDTLEKFTFNIKPGGKDSKTTKYKLIIDGESYEFGTICKISLLTDFENPTVTISCESKILDKIIILDNKKSPVFKTSTITQSHPLTSQSPSFILPCD